MFAVFRVDYRAVLVLRVMEGRVRRSQLQLISDRENFTQQGVGLSDVIGGRAD